jgi:catechol 2,3-dioxygenase-like lactoylglutathione lyase family enzyme
MLNQGKVWATIAVKDLNTAKDFYENTLGLNQIEETPAGVTYESGSSRMLVYPSAYAGTNKATYAGWIVDDVEGTVTDLKSKGVPFQTFEMDGVTWDGDIAVMGNMKSAWFTDPDGNIFAVGNM